MIKTVTLIGAGNLATQLGKALKSAGIIVNMVYSRREENAYALARILECNYTNKIERLPIESDLYILATSDKAHSTVLKSLKFKPKNLVHTAGSISLDSLAGTSNEIGVFYPLQTFTKDRDVEFCRLPILIEASSPAFENKLQRLALKLTNKVELVSSEKRKQLHLAAVFACNFVNHLYALSESILASEKLDFKLLQPLIEETAEKVKILSPQKAQTGPAVRMDMSVINAHETLIKEKCPDLINIYSLLSQSIYKTASGDN